MLLVYAPFELYLTNQDDFWFTCGQMALYTAALFTLSMLLCAAALFLAAKLGDKLFTAGCALLLFVLLGAYLQGNFLARGLPGLDGAIIDWSAYPAERIKSAAVWLLSAVAVIILLRLLGAEKFRRAAGIAGAGLGSILTLTLAILFIANAGGRRTVLTPTDINLFSAAEKENLIVIHVDAVDGEAFEQLLEREPSIKESFEDFTYFDNTMSGYPSTKCSVPQILTGEGFKAQESYNEYLNRAMNASPLIKTLEEREYRIGLYCTDDFYLDEDVFKDRIDNLRQDNPIITSKKSMCAMLLRMAAVKYAPWDFKSKGYNLQQVLQTFRSFRGTEEYAYYSWSNRTLYDKLLGENPFVIDGQRSFKYIMLEGAHNPFVYDGELNYTPNGTYESSVEAAVTLSTAILERLREAGLYESSAIVLLSDHGWNEQHDESNLHQHPILLVKGMNEKHGFSVNKAPIAYCDMAQALVKLLDGASGAACFDWHEGDARERIFLNYHWQDLTRFVEYIQTGQAEDMNTMYMTGKIFGRQ